MKTQINQRLQTVWLVAIATIFIFSAFGSTFAQKGAGARFGTRDPIKCADTKTPARGAITAALAKKYFICRRERVGSEDEYLIENVVVRVGSGRPYNSKTDIMDDIDIEVPIYPIRGSFTKYQCEPLETDPQSSSYNVGKNCNTYKNRKAKGQCWKTTFGDWKCHMVQDRIADDDKKFGVAPPK